MAEQSLSQNQEAEIQKRLDEVVGSVRHLALSDLDYELADDDEITIKAGSDDEPGRLIVQFSVAGIKDSYGDIIKQSAFDEINGRQLAMVWSHKRDQIIGKGVVRMEGKRAIWDGNLFVGKGVPDADMAHTIIKEMKNLQEYSWGFRIKEAKPIKEKGPDGNMYWMGALEITKVDPIEVSPVLKGSHPKTKTLVVKSEDVDAPQTDNPDAADAAATNPVGAPADVVADKGMTVAEEYTAVLAAVASFADRMKALDALRVEGKGRHLSAENLGRLKDLQGELDSLQAQITEILKGAERERGVPVGDRFRFAEAKRRRLDLLLQTGD